MIESLFTGCDTQGNGLVKVSKLIEYLSAVAGDNVEVSLIKSYLYRLNCNWFIYY